MKIPPYAVGFRINYGNGQCTSRWDSFKACDHHFKLWNYGGSFIEFKDADTGEWFPLEKDK